MTQIDDEQDKLDTLVHEANRNADQIAHLSKMILNLPCVETRHQFVSLASLRAYERFILENRALLTCYKNDRQALYDRQHQLALDIHTIIDSEDVWIKSGDYAVAVRHATLGIDQWEMLISPWQEPLPSPPW